MSVIDRLGQDVLFLRVSRKHVIYSKEDAEDFAKDLSKLLAFVEAYDRWSQTEQGSEPEGFSFQCMVEKRQELEYPYLSI